MDLFCIYANCIILASRWLEVVEVNERKQPPIWLILIVVFTVFLGISLGIIYLLRLPWYISMSSHLGTVFGLLLLVIGFFILISAIKALRINRAFGKDIYKSQLESTLVKTGIYRYTRNPLYLGSTILFFGWFFIFRRTFLLIMTFLFIVLFYFVAKWEETELFERFNTEYLQYKNSVSFFIPYPKKRDRE